MLRDNRNNNINIDNIVIINPKSDYTPFPSDEHTFHCSKVICFTEFGVNPSIDVSTLRKIRYSASYDAFYDYEEWAAGKRKPIDVKLLAIVKDQLYTDKPDNVMA